MNGLKEQMENMSISIKIICCMIGSSYLLISVVWISLNEEVKLCRGLFNYLLL